MSKQSKKLHKNIFISWILLFQWYLYFPIAIWMFYFLQYLDFREVAIIGAASTIAGSIFEIPTGAISDIIGRKKTLIISRLFGITSFVMMILGKTFWVFLVARFIQGISQALWSGSLESLQYDTLKESGQKDRFTDVVSRNGVLSWLALFVSSVVGCCLLFFLLVISRSIIKTSILFLPKIKTNNEKKKKKKKERKKE